LPITGFDHSCAATHESRLIHFVIRQNHFNLRSPFSGHRGVGPRATQFRSILQQNDDRRSARRDCTRQPQRNQEVNASETTGAPIQSGPRAKQPRSNTQVPNSSMLGLAWLPTNCPYQRAERCSNESLPGNGGGGCQCVITKL